jgi:anti-anti-sigma regulatory factor
MTKKQSKPSSAPAQNAQPATDPSLPAACAAEQDVQIEKRLIEVSFDPARGLTLHGEATIHSVTQLYEQLKRLEFGPTDQLLLDLSGLTALDTAGAQILIAFKRSRPGLAVCSCPGEIRRFVELTGLTYLLTT